MVVIEDDSELHPEIDDNVQFYIDHLNEGPAVYTRFFDALLIKRTQHRAFFRDLKAFRAQPHIIRMLEDATQDKNKYKEVTLAYLDSRFAHPWCRKTPMKKAFWRSEWGRNQGKQRDAEVVKEEQRLHKLLVPIWIIMRSRMLPGIDIVEQWCENERQQQHLKKEARLTMAALQIHDEAMEKEQYNMLSPGGESTRAVSDSGLAEQDKRAASHAATSVLRLAAAGMIISQTPKRKLRWLTKKPT